MLESDAQHSKKNLIALKVYLCFSFLQYLQNLSVKQNSSASLFNRYRELHSEHNFLLFAIFLQAHADLSRRFTSISA